jgi:hypothetical protein
MTFKYDKDNLFKEFYAAKDEDVKLSKKKTQDEKETDIYTNRIKFFYDHIELKKKHPEYYSDVDIKFDALLKLYETPNPRDAFYMSFFGMTYAQKKAEEDKADDIDTNEMKANEKRYPTNA